METNGQRHDTIVIGGSQSGLTAGYLLRKLGRDFVILDGHKRVGDAWRKRWDSLLLFTPNSFNGLVGLRFPGPRFAKPTKDDMADYLESYAARFELPVRTGARVERLARNGSGYVVTTGDRTYEADNVVIATGASYHPKTPAIADELDPSIVQMHSHHYVGPHQLKPGPVLLVGAGNSGADIAMEVAKTHETWLAGRDVGHVPFRIDSFKARFLVKLVRFAGHRILTLRTPVGRKVAPKLTEHGNPLVRVKPKDLLAAGVRRVGRVEGVKEGRPVLDDGRVLDVANVIWCTGFRQDWSWIDLPSIPTAGVPPHERGIVGAEPGLYFLGLFFQYAATSETVTGVARDATHIVKHLARRSSTAGAGR